jgi:RecA/RadA recombinase
MKTKKTKTKKVKDSFMAAAMAAMGCVVFLKTPRYWQDTGSPSANGVLGSKKYGVPTGKITEVAGPKHAGKTTKVMWLGGKAQRDHDAFVVWVDLENSLENESSTPGVFKNSWASKLGLDTDSRNFYRVYPKILKLKKNRKKGKKLTKKGATVIQSIEFIMKEVEVVCHQIKEKYPDRPIFLAFDSVANMQTEMALDAGFENRNMRVNQDRAQFLSYALPRLLILGANYSIWMYFINQIRVNAMKLFGDNRYTPGGKGIEHNAHVQVWMLPSEKNTEKDDEDEVSSIGGRMVNKKNKAGGGSKAYLKCSYSIRFNKKPEKIMRFGPYIK